MKKLSTHPELNVVVPIQVPAELQVGQWSSRLKRPVALATFVAAAMSTDIWHPVRLEEHLLKLSGSLQKPDRHLRRLLEGIPPHKPKVMAIHRALGGGSVLFWANHPIFHLLDLSERDPQHELVISYALNSLSGPMRYRFWPKTQTGEFAGSTQLDTAQIPDASSLRNAFSDRKGREELSHLDWFTLALATYVQAKRSRSEELAWEAAFVTNAAFDYAVMLHPPLLVTWRDLASIMADLVWDPIGLEGIFRTGGVNLVEKVHFFMDKNLLSLPEELLSIAGIER